MAKDYILEIVGTISSLWLDQLIYKKEVQHNYIMFSKDGLYPLTGRNIRNGWNSTVHNNQLTNRDCMFVMMGTGWNDTPIMVGSFDTQETNAHKLASFPT